MRIFIAILCVLCATPVHTIFDGTCLRKDPPPGVLILPPGSDLVLTCSGHVTVDGVKVRNNSNTKRVVGASQTTVNSIINSGVLNEKHAVENAVSQISPNISLRHGDTGHTVSPTAHMVHSTSVHSLLKAEETDAKSDYQEEDEEEGSRVTGGINSRPLWKWTGRTMGKRDQGATTSWKRGDTLSLSSVRLTDSGTYSCHYGGRKRFSLNVIIADPPEEPRLSCYKKSPSSVIHCEWTPQKPVTITPDCYLLLTKSPTEVFLPSPCSYSSRDSRCSCALGHSEDELRTPHLAYLCVTSMAGNATSSLLDFTPLGVLKPDPPSNVSVRQEEGQETRMVVTWSLPASWKSQDDYFDLIYEIKYTPLDESSFYHSQIRKIRGRRSDSITDAMPGVEYVIQLRTKEEFDGLWSDWSSPVFATSWTDPMSTTTMIPVYEDMESSGTDDSDVAPTFSAVSTPSAEVSAHIFWIFGSFALLSVILGAYIFRHKDRLMSKVQSLNVITRRGASPLLQQLQRGRLWLPLVRHLTEKKNTERSRREGRRK